LPPPAGVQGGDIFGGGEGEAISTGATIYDGGVRRTTPSAPLLTADNPKVRRASAAVAPRGRRRPRSHAWIPTRSEG